MTDATPTVSVVVPVYNRADRIEAAVESVRAQTVDDWELLLVDDGSTDDTGAVIDDLAGEDERIEALHHDSNRGISAARNTGIDAASGEYVCQLDSDDQWRPWKLDRQLDRMTALDATYCGCYTAGVIFDADGILVERVESGVSGDLWPDILARFDVRPHSSHMVRRDCLTAVGGYDPAFPHGVDWDLTIRLAERWQFDYVDEVLVERFFADDNVSGDPAFGDPAYEVGIRERLAEKYCDELRAHPETKRRFDARLAKHRGLAALERGEVRDAVSQFVTATRLEPTPTNFLTLAAGLLGPRAYRFAWRLKRQLP